MSSVVMLVAQPDRHGDAWLRMPPLEEGARYLRVGPGLENLRKRLHERYPDRVLYYNVDFGLVVVKQRQLGMLDDRTELEVFDFTHPTWVHDPGTFCSNCMVPLLEGPEIDPETESDDDDAITLHPDASYPEDLSEALQDADDAPFVVDRDAVCPVCQNTFTLLEFELSNAGLPYACPDCRDVTGQ